MKYYNYNIDPTRKILVTNNNGIFLLYKYLLNQKGGKIICNKIMDKDSCHKKKKCYWNNRIQYCATKTNTTTTKKTRKYTHTLIFLHGFTMSGKDMKNFTETIIKMLPNHLKWKIILPNAPLRKITIYEGDMERAWYDYYTDNVHTEEEINITHLEESRQVIHKLIDKQVKYHGNSKKVFVGGYSQGCCQALDAGLTYAYELGGIIGIKGHIPSPTKEFPLTRQFLWVCHGTSDESIGYNVAVSSYEEYREKIPINFVTLQNAEHELEDGFKKRIYQNLRKWLFSRLKI